jgi:hypothetical protein
VKLISKTVWCILKSVKSVKSVVKTPTKHPCNLGVRAQSFCKNECPDALARGDRRRKVLGGIIACIVAALGTLTVIQTVLIPRRSVRAVGLRIGSDRPG